MMMVMMKLERSVKELFKKNMISNTEERNIPDADLRKKIICSE